MAGDQNHRREGVRLQVGAPQPVDEFERRIFTQVGVHQDQVQLAIPRHRLGLFESGRAQEALDPEAHDDLRQDVAAFDVIVQEQDSRLLQVDPRLGVESGHFTARLLHGPSGRAETDPRAVSGNLTISASK